MSNFADVTHCSSSEIKPENRSNDWHTPETSARFNEKSIQSAGKGFGGNFTVLGERNE